MKSLNEKEFLELVAKHQNIVHKVCHMFAHDEDDKRDLFQEITIKLWLGYKTFNGQAAITTWMYRVALNTAITIQRKEKRKAEIMGITRTHVGVKITRIKKKLETLLVVTME